MKGTSIHYLVPGVLAVAFAASLWAQTSDHDPVSAKPMAWLHLALEHDSPSVTGDRELGQKINELGRGGWELVDVETVMDSGSTTRTLFFFKKPL